MRGCLLPAGYGRTVGTFRDSASLHALQLVPFPGSRSGHPVLTNASHLNSLPIHSVRHLLWRSALSFSRTKKSTAENQGDQHECDRNVGKSGIVRAKADRKKGHAKDQKYHARSSLLLTLVHLFQFLDFRVISKSSIEQVRRAAF